MKLAEAIAACDDQAIIDRLIELYDDLDGEREAYAYALSEIRSLEPFDKSRFMIVVAASEPGCRCDGEGFVSVSGIAKDDPGETYSLVFTDWREWLAMEVSDESVDEFGLLDCVAHIVWEMTFAGCSNEAVLEQRRFIMEEAEAVKSGEAELIPFDDICPFDDPIMPDDDDDHGCPVL